MDNGNEFAQHRRVAKALQAKVYFAHPYCAWERGVNENTNGLLRQYFPKGTNFKILSLAKIRRAEKRLNERPRKALAFRSPKDIFQLGNP
jgi:transposase, IS30 family